MDDVSPEAAELLLQYMYGCPQADLDLPSAVALFQASDKYAMSSLHQQCTRLLKSLITFDNIFDLAELAQLHHSSELLQVRNSSSALAVSWSIDCPAELPVLLLHLAALPHVQHSLWEF